mmetsp:Transcript_101849/g.270996  ORF Transcript_101849/g.270996 Transcript_101849/m.270996 type:complete len:320 (-) Transcript_101849:242-1201(-)
MEAPSIQLLVGLKSQLHRPRHEHGRPLLQGPVLQRPEQVEISVLQQGPDVLPPRHRYPYGEVAAAGEVVTLVSAGEDDDRDTLTLHRLHHGVEALVTGEEDKYPLLTSVLDLVQECSNPVKEHYVRSVRHLGPRPVHYAAHLPQRHQPVALPAVVLRLRRARLPREFHCLDAGDRCVDDACNPAQDLHHLFVRVDQVSPKQVHVLEVPEDRGLHRGASVAQCRQPVEVVPHLVAEAAAEATPAKLGHGVQHGGRHVRLERNVPVRTRQPPHAVGDVLPEVVRSVPLQIRSAVGSRDEPLDGRPGDGREGIAADPGAAGL